MKIKSINQSSVTQEEKQIFDTYLELLEVHKKVFIYSIEGEYFIYKAIGRKDFINIFSNQDLTAYDKEEIVCETCVLYPEAYDFSNCANGGLPTILSKEILRSSYVSSDEQLESLMNYFREDMLNIQNQISCLIHEAFPNLDFETIENFDMETTLKYLSRSEWILVNLRDMKLNYDPFSGKPWKDATPEPPNERSTHSKVYSEENTENLTSTNSTVQKEQSPSEEESDYIDFIPGETIEERYERLKTHKIKKEVLTPEKLERLKKIAPDINWTYQNKEDDFKVDSSRI